MLQAMALTIIEQAEKAVDPPMAMSFEAFQRDISLMSGGVTFADLGESGDIRKAMQVIETSNNFSIGLDLKQDVRAGDRRVADDQQAHHAERARNARS
jgi:hypothetical protein